MLFIKSPKILLPAIAITLLTATLFYFQKGFIKKVDFSLYDSLLAKVEQTEPSGLVSIVYIDEKSLSQFGQWPWPRYKIAKLLDKINQFDVLAVGIDLLFPESDRSSLKKVYSDLNDFYPEIPLSLDKIPEFILNSELNNQFNNDLQLSKTLESGPFVLAYYFSFKKNNQQNASKLTAAEKIHPLNFLRYYLYELPEQDSQFKSPFSPYQAENILTSLDSFTNAVNFSGFINVSPNSDGVIRSVPLLMEYQNRVYPNLSLATLMKAVQVQQQIIKVSENGSIQLLLDDQPIPLDKKAKMLIHFRQPDPSGKETFQLISAADLLNNKISKQQLTNQIVILGSSAASLFDLKSTPYQSVIHGAEIHATIIDNILRNDFISQPWWGKLLELLILLTAAIISMFIIFRSKAVISLLLNLVIIVALLIISFKFLQNGEYISVSGSIVTIVLNFILLSVLQYWSEEKKLAKQTIELNKIQESAIKLLKNTNIELEETSTDLENKIKANSLSLTGAFEALDKSNQELSDSLQYSASIQRSLLPQADILTTHSDDSFVIWEPRDELGGDIYFISKTANGYVIAVIDCTGHGIPGSLLTMIAISALRKIIDTDSNESPAQILNLLNQSVKNTLGQNKKNAISDDGLEISLCCIDVDKEQLKYAGAGLSLTYIQQNKIIIEKADRQKIGYKQSKRSDFNFQFTEKIISLKHPTYCYLFTDGIIDQVGGNKKLSFGNRRLRDFLLNNHQLPFSQQKQQLLALFSNYQGKQKRRDDVTMIGFAINS